MTKRKPKPIHAKVSLVASCEIFSTSPMVCPLCGLRIPAKTPHSCQKVQP